jgi:hypothetical protein
MRESPPPPSIPNFIFEFIITLFLKVKFIFRTGINKMQD